MGLVKTGVPPVSPPTSIAPTRTTSPPGISTRATTAAASSAAKCSSTSKRHLNIKAALKADADPEKFKLQLTSQPFPVRGYKRIAVKVVDVYGNESTVVRDL